MMVLISCIVKSTVGVFLSWWYSVDRTVWRKSVVEEEFGEGRCLGKVENLPRRLGGLFIKHWSGITYDEGSSEFPVELSVNMMVCLCGYCPCSLKFRNTSDGEKVECSRRDFQRDSIGKALNRLSNYCMVQWGQNFLCWSDSMEAKKLSSNHLSITHLSHLNLYHFASLLLSLSSDQKCTAQKVLIESNITKSTSFSFAYPPPIPSHPIPSYVYHRKD
jgi:hypothetical protein